MKILVVDDEFVSLSKLSLLLSGFGQCDAATHGGQALEKFKLAHQEGSPYDLVTLDVDMPDMSGQQVVEAIRNWETDQGIRSHQGEAKILMVTGMTDGKNIMSAFRKGCEGYIPKPFNKADIEKALGEIGLVSPS